MSVSNLKACLLLSPVLLLRPSLPPLFLLLLEQRNTGYNIRNLTEPSFRGVE